MHKLLIAGSRNFSNYELLKKMIKPSNVSCIISGCARGADYLAIRYAEEMNIPILKYPANWDKYGKSAGYIRNQQMVNEATACICFWDGQSKGTKITIELAKTKGIPTKVVYYNNI